MAPARRAAKKAAVPPSPLNGCSIAIAGTFPGASQASIKERITNLGATFATTVQKDTECLIATQADYDKQSTKVKAAIANSVPIVSIEWLDDCESSNSHVNTMKYLVLSAKATSSQPQANGSTKGGKAKRAASPDPPPQPTKKQKKPDGAPAAKVGDGQNAKSTKIQIPLDEYCPLASYSVYFGDDGTIYDASLNQTNASANNNKFYRIQVRAYHPNQVCHETDHPPAYLPSRQARVQDLDPMGPRR
jgi:poly [ADP-ribose] polymerase